MLDADATVRDLVSLPLNAAQMTETKPDRQQCDRFIEIARQLGCDEDGFAKRHTARKFDPDQLPRAIAGDG